MHRARRSTPGGQTSSRSTAPSEDRPPELSDEEVHDLIRHVIFSSPFTGEGYRKVTAHLRRNYDCHVGRKRVLRLMRRAGLLAPQRAAVRRRRRSAQRDRKVHRALQQPVAHRAARSPHAARSVRGRTIGGGGVNTGLCEARRAIETGARVSGHPAITRRLHQRSLTQKSVQGTGSGSRPRSPNPGRSSAASTSIKAAAAPAAARFAAGTRCRPRMLWARPPHSSAHEPWP